MDALYADVTEILRRPAVVEMALDVILCAVPIWMAVMIGMVIGWSWRPRWTGLLFLGLRSKIRFWTAVPPGLGATRLWFAFTALSALSVSRKLWTDFISGKAWGEVKEVERRDPVVKSLDVTGLEGEDRILEIEKEIVTRKDLDHLLNLLDDKVGDKVWYNLMERTTQNMLYQAWRHEPEAGPVMYRSRTVFEDATPEIVRDFFWDDDFRLKWDPMLGHFKILKESSLTGEMIVHWIKKFPFFCSDREYIIGRRIWESEKSYYCVTKGVPYPALQKREKPKRVEHYFSSWCIKKVESLKQDGQLTACEVTLVHYEDMGIPNDISKVGVRHGMWGTVKKLQSGMRAYQLARKSETPLCRSALLARITTKIPDGWTVCSLDSGLDLSGEQKASKEIEISRKGHPGLDRRWVAIGGLAALAFGASWVCSVHKKVTRDNPQRTSSMAKPSTKTKSFPLPIATTQPT